MNHTIPDSLVHYKQALEDAIGRDVISGAARRRRRQRLGIRFAVAGGATAAVALGALSVLVGSAPSPTPAAAAVIREATAALAQAPGTILHAAFTAVQDNGDGTAVSWSQESFSEQQPPYDSLMINRRLPGTPDGVEQASVSGVSQVYDPTRNTIYVGPPPSPSDSNETMANVRQYRFSRGPAPGTYRVRVPVAYRVGAPESHQLRGHATHSTTGAVRGRYKIQPIYRSMTVTAAQAKALRNGTDVVKFHAGVVGTQDHFRDRVTHMRVVPAPRATAANAAPKDASDLDPFSAAFRKQILALLRSGGVRVVGHATVDGRDTIEIQSSDGHNTYYVMPDTYTPVELSTKGTTGGVVVRFDTYEELPAGSNGDLLSLTARHPTATVDRNAGDYNAAAERLFPHG
jgi:hypothetical protein